MKKNIKRFSVICISLIVCCFSVSRFFAITTFTENGYTYSFTDNGTVCLRGWDYSSNMLTVPNKLSDTYVTEIGNYAFKDDSNVKGLDLSSATRLMGIGTSAFAYSGISGELTVPSNVAKLGDSAFEGCEAITKVTLKSASEILPSQFFKNCTALNDVEIYNGIEVIESYAFYNCTSLKSITLPRSIREIKSTAFRNCSNFTIKGYRDSYAQQFAQDNGYDFYILDPLLGDTTGDGNVDIMDATYIQKYKIGAQGYDLTEYQRRCADVNRDGNVTVRDATLIQMKLAKYDVDF